MKVHIQPNLNIISSQMMREIETCEESRNYITFQLLMFIGHVLAQVDLPFVQHSDSLS